MANGQGQFPRLPGPKDRLSIIGTTGSGKTVAALWHLSRTNLETMPWVTVDFKGDENIGAIEGAEHVELDHRLTSKSKGLYVVHPLPQDKEALEQLMWRLWERGNVGLYLDEAYMADNEAFQAILTQGRSKRIPVIALTQRPVWCSRFLFSEASFIQVFRLNDKRDKKTVESFVPVDLDAPMEEFSSQYFDVGKNRTWQFQPVPGIPKILEAIDAKLTTNRKHVFI